MTDTLTLSHSTKQQLPRSSRLTINRPSLSTPALSPKSGTHTYGLERFWNSRQRRSEKGLEVSAIAWLDITDNCAYGLSVEQTPPSDKTSEPHGTRIDAYLEQLKGVVCDHHLSHLRYVIADGYYSKRKFLDGVRALGMHPIGKLRRDANLRYLYQGPGHPGPGRPKTYDGKVHWDDLSRFERVQSEDDDIVLYHQVLNHVHLRRDLRVVLVVDTRSQRRAVLFSSDTDLDAQTLYRGYKARFQIEFLFRDAKQFTSLSACQATPGLDPGQAAFSLQCQYECSDLGQAGSTTAKRQCSGRVFHGESQTARLQPPSAGANFSAFSPGA